MHLHLHLPDEAAVVNTRVQTLQICVIKLHFQLSEEAAVVNTRLLGREFKRVVL